MAQEITYPVVSTNAPLGGATSANQVLEIAQLTAINASTASSDTKLSSQATAANQATANASLATIATNTGAATPAGTNIIGKVGIDQTTPGTTNGVQVVAALPVGANVIGKVSIDQTVPGTTNLVALAANQSVNVAQINAATPMMGNGVTGTGSQRVTIASDNTAFSVNATLSAGSAVIGHVINDAGSAIIGKVGIDQTTPGTTNLVALAANQSVNVAQINGITPLMGAGNTGTGSQRVTIASDQAAIPTKSTTLTSNNTVTSAIDVIASVDVSAYSNISYQSIVTGSSTVTFYSSNDNSTFQPLAMGYVSGSGTTTQVISSNAILFAPVNFRYFRATCTTYSSGNVTGYLVANSNGASSDPGLRSVTVANSIAVTQSGTWTVQPGNTPNTTAWLVNNGSKPLANAPVINANASVNITTAAYVQLVASTTLACSYVEVYNTCASSIYFSVGAAASEVIQFIIPPGGNGMVPLKIAASARIAVKAADVNATTGSLIVNFWS